jgi:2-isopropylmalate synthase
VAGAVFGVGIHPNIVTASILAVLSGLNRIYARSAEDMQGQFFAATRGMRGVKLA